MGVLNPPIVTFTGGVVGKLIHNRVDIQSYPTSAEEQYNCWPYAQGPLDRRPGGKLVDEFTDHTKRGRLVDFVFSIDQSYIILATEEGFEFYTQDGKLTIDSVTSQLQDTSFDQTTVDLVQAATITASSTGGTGTLANLKTNAATTWWESTIDNTQWLRFDLGSAKRVRELQIRAATTEFDRAPTGFIVEASASGSFTGEQTTILTVTEAETVSYTASEIKRFRLAPATTYRYWRISMSDKQEAFGASLEFRVANVKMYDLWWRDESEGAASSTLTGGKLYLDGDGANEAAVIQEFTINETNTRHILKLSVFHGPVNLMIGTTRGGYELGDETGLGTGTHYIEFTPTAATAYVRLYHAANAGRILDEVKVMTATTGFTVEHPYIEAELPELQWQQIGDVVYITDGHHWPRKLIRRSHRSWSLERFLPLDGPFGKTNTTPTTLAVSATSGQALLTASQPIFDATNDEDVLYEAVGPGHVAERTATSSDIATDGIKVYGVRNAERTFQVEITGSFTATITLQRSSGNENSYSDFRTYTAPVVEAIDDNLDNETWYYRLIVKAGAYTSGTVNMRIFFSGGSTSGVARVISVNSDTEAIVEIIEPFSNTSGSATWKRGEWSPDQGFPVATTRGFGRLWFGRGIQIWGSKSDDFTSFLAGSEADNAISVTMATPSSDAIRYMSFLTHLVIGTATSESIGLGNTQSEPVSPSNFQIIDSTYEGGALVMPVTVAGSVIYPHRNRRKLMQFTQNPKALSETSYISVDLNRLSPDLLESGIKAIAVQKEPERRIYVVLSNGDMVALLFRREEDVVAWSTIHTDGRYEDVRIVAQEDQDAVYVIVRRKIGGVWKRFLEKFAPESALNDEDRLHLDSYLSYELQRPDSIIEPSGTTGTITVTADSDTFDLLDVGSIIWLNGGRGQITGYTSATEVEVEVWSDLDSLVTAAPGLWGFNPEVASVSGLDHLEGMTVRIYGDRMDLGTAVVSGGSVTLPKNCSVVHVGLGYESRYKSLKLSYAAQKGTALNMPKAVKNLAFLMHKAAPSGIFFGHSFENLKPLILKSAQTPLGEPDKLFTGEKFEAFNARYNEDARICIKWTGCASGIIAGLVPGIDEHDR